MEAPEILPRIEVEAITGLVRPSAQLRFLQEKLQLPAWINARNRVIVYRDWLGQDQAKATKKTRSTLVVDFDALDAV